jgi:hypothetical protein
LIHHSAEGLLTSQSVKALSAVDLTFQLRDVSEIVESKRIIGIQKVGSIEKPLRFIYLMFVDRLDAFAIQLLDRGRDGVLRQSNPYVSRLSVVREQSNQNHGAKQDAS